MEEFSADSVFAVTCLLAAILYSAVGQFKQAAFFFGFALFFVAKDVLSGEPPQTTITTDK